MFLFIFIYGFLRFFLVNISNGEIFRNKHFSSKKNDSIFHIFDQIIFFAILTFLSTWVCRKIQGVWGWYIHSLPLSSWICPIILCFLVLLSFIFFLDEIWWRLIVWQAWWDIVQVAARKKSFKQRLWTIFYFKIYINDSQRFPLNW